MIKNHNSSTPPNNIGLISQYHAQSMAPKSLNKINPQDKENIIFPPIQITISRIAHIPLGSKLNPLELLLDIINLGAHLRPQVKWGKAPQSRFFTAQAANPLNGER